MALPTPRHGQPPVDWLQMVTAQRSAMDKLSPAVKASRLIWLGHTAEIRGDEALARELFSEAAAIDPKYAQQAGEMAARDDNWLKAAEHFGTAAKANPANRIAKYLHAHALLRAGDEEAGKLRMRQINLEVIDPNARFALTAQMVQPWLRQEFFHQHDIICRTALPISSRYANSSRERGNSFGLPQPEQAIHSWLQEMLYVLGPTSNMTEPEGYTAFVHIVHKTRARAAIDIGNVEVAQRELDICEQIQSGDTRLATFLLPRLRSQKIDVLADKLFEKTAESNLRLCQEFPQSAKLLNETAWLFARSQRKLPEALELTQQAISLEADVAAYHDTLAEVHFQLGHREAATAAARRCLEMTGPTKQSLARLKHFSDSELRTLDETR